MLVCSFLTGKSDSVGITLTKGIESEYDSSADSEQVREARRHYAGCQGQRRDFRRVERL